MKPFKFQTASICINLTLKLYFIIVCFHWMEEYVLYIPIVFCNVIISNLTYLGASLLYHQTIMVMLMDKVKMYALVVELKKTISYKNRYRIIADIRYLVFHFYLTNWCNNLLQMQKFICFHNLLPHFKVLPTFLGWRCRNVFCCTLFVLLLIYHVL